MSMNLQQLALALKLEYRGDDRLEISGVASPGSAAAGDLCFISQRKFLPDLVRSKCSAAILPAALAAEAGDKALLLSADPQYSFVRAIEILGCAEGRDAHPGIHPSAQVDASARLGEAVGIGALAVIEAGAEIGAGTRIGAGSIVGAGARIGRECRVMSRVILGQGITIGDRCILHSGAVVGADGFGLVMHDDRWLKVPQLGSVVIEDDVEIGANTTVDRGALDNTVIEQGCKLDNLIQVAHNVRIGAHTAIAACVGIAGSASIGRYCKISGGAGILGHLSIADHVTITAMSLVTKDIKQPGIYSSGTPLLENSLWHRNNARYKMLDRLARIVARLDKSGK